MWFLRKEMGGGHLRGITGPLPPRGTEHPEMQTTAGCPGPAIKRKRNRSLAEIAGAVFRVSDEEHERLWLPLIILHHQFAGRGRVLNFLVVNFRRMLRDKNLVLELVLFLVRLFFSLGNRLFRVFMRRLGRVVGETWNRHQQD